MNPIFKKLNYKDQKQIHIVNAPPAFAPIVDAMRGIASIKNKLTLPNEVEFFLGFVTKQKDVDDLTRLVASLLKEAGLLWFAYPKGTSKKYTCEFNRDTGWKVLGERGFEPVRMVAIDEDWTALRFRKAEKIKKMTRSFAMSDEGKQKVATVKKRTQ